MFAPSWLGTSSKAPSCMNLLSKEGQALDQQFLRFSKGFLNQYKLVLAGTFYSWTAGTVWRAFSPPFVMHWNPRQWMRRLEKVLEHFWSQMGEKRSLGPNLQEASCFQVQNIIYIGLRIKTMSAFARGDLGPWGIRTSIWCPRLACYSGRSTGPWRVSIRR